MITKEIVFKNFEKCKEPIDYAQKYKYFNQKNRLKEEGIKDTICYIEQMSLLGALFVAVLKEKDTVPEYISEFLERNRECITKKIKENSEETVAYMQILYICLMYLNEKERNRLCKEIFSGDNEQENQKDSEHYAKVFVSAVLNFHKDIVWEEKYCEIAISIYEARNKDIDFLHWVEVGMRKKSLGYIISNKDAKLYFDLLCSHEDYEAARLFLENFDGTQGFLGMEGSEFIKMIYAIPNPGVLAYGKYASNKLGDGEYTYEKWYEDVIKYNDDEECIKWIRLTVYYHELSEIVKNEEWDSFDAMLLRAADYELFDMDKIINMKQLVESFAFICNQIIVKKTRKVLGFLRAIEEININAFSRKKYLVIWNQKDSIRENYNYSDIKEKLFTCFSVKDAVFIYMNSHLKAIIPIEEIVEMCASFKGENLYELFKKYPLEGKMNLGSKLSSISDKIFVSPIGVASNVSFKVYLKICDTYGFFSKEANAFNKKMIRSEENWYAKNKNVAELIENGDVCTYCIKAYKKGKGIFANNFRLDEDIEKARAERRNTQYPKVVMDWLEQIRTTQKYLEWNKDEPIYGSGHLDMNQRVNIALGILEVVCALQNNKGQLEKFLLAITIAPLEELNEFRYISTQKRLDFVVPKENYQEIRNCVIQKAESVLQNQSLPESLRKNIYFNTIIRKVYDLQRACRYFGNEFASMADEPFVLALRFEEKCSESYYFSTRGIHNTVYSRYRFVFNGFVEEELTPNTSYLVALNNYDAKQQCFTLAAVNLSKQQTEQWKKYLRKVRDIKMVTHNDELAEIKEELRRYDVRVTSREHIAQLTHELDIIFKRNKCSIESALKILEVISEKNPYMDNTKDYSEYREEFEQDYFSSYENFLQDYKENYRSAMGFCDFFFASYLKVFVDFDIFVGDIVSEKNTKEMIVNYCVFKGYVK